MNRMFANRGLVLAAIVVCATGLLGAAALLVKVDSPTSVPSVAKPPAAAPAPVAKAVQIQGQDPRCANQDRDDDARESKVRKAKPDTDNEELECGDQNDDDREVGEDRDGSHGERAKPAPAKTERSAPASPIKR